eukprot:TRINITY_DN3452_c0_g1_i1.p1 TRINITY_DN3452_c0_g1~~TRINITY_DN3452_c0_g1_i1.p1  ORF type:complete len:318 (+),score=86.36 TRINITY_DN3452_c0_g1_i1:60-1013(+)
MLGRNTLALGRFIQRRAAAPSQSKRRMTTSTEPRRVINTVGVIGAGQMGGGIAQVAAQIAKKNVILMDSNADQASKAVKFIDTLMKKNIEKGKATAEERDATLSRISTTSNLSDLSRADFIIEAATERVQLKETIFRDLSSVVPQDVILATNTSSISITRIASVTNRPDRVIGMHFMNPVPVMKLVEIIQGLATSKATLDITLNLATEMDKTTATAQDRPGFIANRLLMPYINESVYALMEGLGTREDIDKTMKLGTNMPMGPLTLADFIGLDTCLAIMRILHEELGDSKYRPCPLLVKYVEAGWLGKKTGRGFYQY